MQVINFTGTKNPVVATATPPEIVEMQRDPTVRVTDIQQYLKRGEWIIMYHFKNPTQAALDMQLPLVIEIGEEVGV